FLFFEWLFLLFSSIFICFVVLVFHICDDTYFCFYFLEFQRMIFGFIEKRILLFYILFLFLFFFNSNFVRFCFSFFFFYGCCVGAIVFWIIVCLLFSCSCF